MKEKFFPVNEWQVQWKRCPFQEKAQVYLAVSGGADSMALLDTARFFVHSSPQPEITGLIALHFNHRIRKKEANQDEALVEHFCSEKGLPFFKGQADVPALSKSQKISLELAGRKARYQFFQRVMEEQKKEGTLPVLVTAHHRGDQAETLLLHLFRGAGADGLSGMRVWTKVKTENGEFYLFRPFLSLPKTALVTWCEGCQIPYRKDQSNDDPRFLRNRIRLQVLPLIKEINPAIEESLSQTARLLQQENDFLDRLTEEKIKMCLFDGRKKPEEDFFSQGDVDSFFSKRNACLMQGLALFRKPFTLLDPVLQRRILRKILQKEAQKEEGPSFEEIEKIRALFGQPAGKWTKVCDMIFLCDFQGVLVFSAQKKQVFSVPIEEKKRLTLPSPGQRSEVEWPFPTGRIIARYVDKPPSLKDLRHPRFCYLDPEGLSALWVQRQSGQYPFEKFGGGKKALRRMMNDWHIPDMIRPNYPVLCDEKGALWVPWAGRTRKRLIQQDQKILEVEWRQSWTKD